jgi:hypothetical protein
MGIEVLSSYIFTFRRRSATPASKAGVTTPGLVVSKLASLSTMYRLLGELPCSRGMSSGV